MGTAATSIDVNGCDVEPIHIPGSIQPHGIMLVADQNSLIVRHVAGEIEQRLGVTLWEGQELSVLIGSLLSAKIAALSQPGFVGQLQGGSGELLDLSAHPSGRYVIIELEPASVDRPTVSLLLDTLAGTASRFEESTSLAALCSTAASEFRRLTAFDRVMVYQFLDDDVGRVVAEDRRADMHSFLNHHFPASDIPRQARDLYVRNLVRVIPDINYHPANLRPGWSAAEPLDMSDSGLRSVSPVHLQYLRNMNVAASASVSIVKDGRLWGLIACHHETPQFLTYDLRAVCRSLAAALGRQIKAMEEVEGYRQRIRLRNFEDEIVGLLSPTTALGEALNAHLNELGRMMTSDGFAVLRGTELAMTGVCPVDHDVRMCAAWLLAHADAPVFSTDRLSDHYAPAANFQSVGSGLLAATLSAREPWLLLWFRVEQIETINWAGNPHEPDSRDEQGQLTPRASFAAWRETVRGRAFSWTLPEVDAARRLRATLLDIQQSQLVQELNCQLTKILQDKDLLLQQNEFLIREVNHRVQDSLQLVSSYLNLQARTSDNPELLVALNEARRRIGAVALVHRRLYHGDQLAFVDTGRYIRELCADTASSMGRDWAQHLSLNISHVMVSAERAVTLGLLLTELLTNANKYAYGGRAGPIEIGLTADRSLLHLTVADSGVGKVSQGDGFGLLIVQGLASLLGGNFQYGDNNPGLRVVVTMPIDNPPRRE
jgi:chemotaxis family two-component system sensor kinase Cph1